jgi:phosphoribosylanthranilate isomerase
MMVKVCGITRREDAEAAVEAGASALGFVFVSSSPRCVAPERAAELGRDLLVWKVGIFVEETAASIAAVMRAARLDIAQIYGGEAPAGARVWNALRVDPARGAGFSLQPGLQPRLGRGLKSPFQAEACSTGEAVLLDGLSNGQRFDWTLARGFAPKVIVAGGLNPANVAEAIRAARPWGVDASSGLESAPGVKDHSKIKRFVEAALSA